MQLESLATRLIDNGYESVPEYYMGNVRILDASHHNEEHGIHVSLKISPTHFDLDLDFSVILTRGPRDNDIRHEAFENIRDAVGLIEIRHDDDLIGKEFYTEAMTVDGNRFGPIVIAPVKETDIYPRVPDKLKEGACGLYVIECLSGDETQQFCKIGVTANPAARLSQIANSSPFKVQYAYFRALKDREEALDNESRLHALLANERMNGEWFSVHPRTAIHALTSVVER